MKEFDKLTEAYMSVVKESYDDNPEALLFAIVEAWKEYQIIDGDYTYHMAEGGDSDYTKEEWNAAHAKFNNLIDRAAKLKQERVKFNS